MEGEEILDIVEKLSKSFQRISLLEHQNSLLRLKLRLSLKQNVSISQVCNLA
jgi:hypothetical protein